MISPFHSILDFTGYVHEVTDVLTSKETGNKYFDVRLKTSGTTTDIIRVMTKQNPGIKIQLFKDKKFASQPVKLTNVTKVASGTLFFNSNRGSRIEDVSAVTFKNTPLKDLKLIDIKDKFSGTFTVKGCIKWLKEATQPSPSAGLVRDAMLADGTHHIPISILKDTIDLAEEGKYYKFINVAAKYFFGQKLYITDSTEVIILEEGDAPTINWEAIDLNPPQVTPKKATMMTLHSPDILSVKLNFYPICIRSKCSKKITVLPGDEVVQCKDCGCSMLLEKCKCGFNGTIEFEHDSKEINLTVFADTLGKYLKEDVVEKYKDCQDKLNEKILRMQNILITYNTKRVITEISDIQQ